MAFGKASLFRRDALIKSLHFESVGGKPPIASPQASEVLLQRTF